MNVEQVRALASPDGQALLRSLPPYDESAVFTLQASLRATGVPADLVAAALTQQRLRERARAKFGEFAHDMLFTSDGLEQATRIEVATVHAARFASLSLATVHDLGCGIGADAITMSVLGVTVSAIDADPVTAAVADTNLRPWPESRARVGLVEDFVPPADAMRGRIGAWLDPARRVAGVADATGRPRRLHRLEDLSPSWSTVQAIAAAVPATGAKLAPSFPHAALPPGAEAQWVSWEGDVVECSLWWGPLARRPGRTALLLGARRPSTLVEDTGDDAEAARSLADLGEWFHEADRAVVQAGLLGGVAARLGGLEVDPGTGYLTTHDAVTLPETKRYAVRAAFPFHAKSLRGWLRDRGITGLTIKKRAGRIDDAALRRQLRIGAGAGDGEQATIVLTRVAGDGVVLVVDPA